MKDFSPGVQVKLDNMTPTAEKLQILHINL